MQGRILQFSLKHYFINNIPFIFLHIGLGEYNNAMNGG